jgi:hypothetical protein
MNTKYYVRGKRINLDDWDIEFDESNLDDFDEEYRDDAEYITDRHGKILGVGWEL